MLCFSNRPKAKRWRTEAQPACRVANVEHTQSAQLYDKRRLCLERGRRDAEALVSELVAGGPAAVQRQ